MFKPLSIAFALALTATSAFADTDCNVNIREGKLERLEIPQEVERVILKADKTEEKKSMSAKDAHQYAVLTIKLAAGKSIGLYDYSLTEENGTEKFNITAMSIENGAYQRKIWEVRASGDTKVSWVGIHGDDSAKEYKKGSESTDAETVVKLLFEVPSGSKRFKLIPRLLDKTLLKEYGVSKVLDFDNMSAAAAAPSSDEKEEAGTE